MSILEYLPIALAVTGVALRFVISKPAAQAVQAWEKSSSTVHEKPAQAAPLAVPAPARAFATA
ncbi:MAG TPA: hypothetical protein VF774_08150 [Pseudoduganella sp.]